MGDHADIDHTGLTGVGAATTVATDTIFDAKGDLPVGTGANTSAKLTVGANDTILMADSGQSTGLKWVAAGTPSDLDYDDVAAAGTADTFSRGDHVHGMPSAGGGGGFGPPVYLDPFVTSDHNSGWNTYVAVGSAASCRLPYWQSSGSQNSENIWSSVLLEDGTYRVDIVVFKANNHGIIHLQIDGTDLTTFDTYAGSSTPDQRMVATGLVISGDGDYAVSLQMSTKNASSSNYFGLVNRVIFTRTA